MVHQQAKQCVESSIASRSEWSERMTDALSTEHMSIAKALMLNAYADAGVAMEQAIVQGDLDFVKWLYEECAAPIDDGMVALAGLNGHTALFKYLDSETCPQLTKWPDGVKRIESNIGADLYQFEEADDACLCYYQCEYQCLNRASQVVCTDTNCTVGSTCGNRFETNQHLIELFDAGTSKQLGVRAKELIPSETLLVEYVGEVITNEEVKRRDYTAYTMDLEGDLYIDAAYAGNLSRFINHDCASVNCESRRFWCGTTYRIGIVALQDIQAGEEILIRYSKELSFKCMCGAQTCVSK